MHAHVPAWPHEHAATRLGVAPRQVHALELKNPLDVKQPAETCAVNHRPRAIAVAHDTHTPARTDR